MIDVTIQRLWNGQAAEVQEQVRLTAALDTSDLTVTTRAHYHGDPAPVSPPGRCPGLWNHEVVELFLVGPDGHYFELELGPHGQYLALLFSGVRQVVRDDLAVDYRVTRQRNDWIGEARLPAEQLPRPIERWNAFAIHGVDAARRYLAAAPTGGTHPDFHRIAKFPELR